MLNRHIHSLGWLDTIHWLRQACRRLAWFGVGLLICVSVTTGQAWADESSADADAGSDAGPADREAASNDAATDASPRLSFVMRAVKRGDWVQVLRGTPVSHKIEHERVHWWRAAALLEVSPAEFEAARDVAGYERRISPERRAAANFARAYEANPSWLTARQWARLPTRRDKLNELADTFPFDPRLAHAAGAAYIRDVREQHPAIGAAGRQAEPDVGMAGLDPAIRQLERAVVLDPSVAAFHEDLAHAYFIRGDRARRDLERAVRHARRASALGPAGWEVAMLEGRALMALDRYDAAAGAFEEAAAAAPAKAVMIDLHRAQALLEARRVEPAFELFAGVLAERPHHPTVRRGLGRAAYHAGQYKQAMHYFQQQHARSEHPTDLFWQGRVAYAMEDDPLARQCLDRAIEAAEARDLAIPPIWRYYRGRVRWALDGAAPALSEFVMAHEGEPANRQFARAAFSCALEADAPRAALMVSYRLGKAGHRALAQAGIEKVLDHWPAARPVNGDGLGEDDTVEQLAHRVTALLDYRDGHFRSAAYAYRRVTGGDRAHAGWCKLLAGDTTAAAEDFRLVLQQQPRDVDGETKARMALKRAISTVGLAAVHLETDQRAEARELFRDAGFPNLDEAGRAWWEQTRNTGRLWTSKSRAVLEATGLIKPLPLLGVIETPPNFPAHQPHQVLYVTPGSALDQAEPAVRPLDVIERIDGHPATDAGLQAFNAKPIADKPIEIQLRRRGESFTVQVNLRQASQRLGAEGQTQ